MHTISWSIGLCMICNLALGQALQTLFTPAPEVLPGTSLWVGHGQIPDEIMAGAHAWIEKKIDQAAVQRGQHWHYDFSSPALFRASIQPQRERLMNILGIPFDLSSKQNSPLFDTVTQVQFWSAWGDDPDVASTSRYRIRQIRWSVLPGVWGEGLLLTPTSHQVQASCIVLGHANQTPEQLCGLAPGIDPESQIARRLAEQGVEVLIPVLINRDYLFEGQNHQQSHREWLYRQGYHLGHHLIGVELLKVQQAAHWMKSLHPQKKVGLAGYGDGGLLAMFTAALDETIESTLVSGYFGPRERCWQEPLDRNIWDLLTTFGDAELCSMITPRALTIEHSEGPVFRDEIARLVDSPLMIETYPFTGFKGALSTPDFKAAQGEYERFKQLLPTPWGKTSFIYGSRQRPVQPGSPAALTALAEGLGIVLTATSTKEGPRDLRQHAEGPDQRQRRQVKEIENYYQHLLGTADQRRDEQFLYRLLPEIKHRRWSTRSWHAFLPWQNLVEQADTYREDFKSAIIGHFEDGLAPLQPLSKRLYDEPGWAGYEIKLDVFDNFYASGILLVPKDLVKGEKRPTIVVQHGRNGEPRHVIEGQTSYYDLGQKLVTQGYVVFIPQGLFRGEDAYRLLNRKANTLGKTLFSFILAQHEQILNWLWTVPFVDPARIAFYGKSYGGETAMRIPSILNGYALSICSGDFGDWARKVIDVHASRSFMYTFEWEMPYWRMGTTYSYAEMAYLIFPRPFMVERGHDDLVQPDEWVAAEYAKVRYLYDRSGLADRTTIEYFNGGHAARNAGIFDFLRKHLAWP